MSVTSDDIKHLANLSRLNVSDEELEEYRKEFSAILDYVQMIQEVDISGIAPVVGASLNINTAAEDEVKNISGQDARDRFIPLAPGHSDEYIETISPLKDVE